MYHIILTNNQIWTRPCRINYEKPKKVTRESETLWIASWIIVKRYGEIE